MKSANRMKERVLADKWRNAPYTMLVKKALQAIVDAGAGDAGMILAAELARLNTELATVKQQLRNAEAAVANWRYKYRELAGIGK